MMYGQRHRFFSARVLIRELSREHPEWTEAQVQAAAQAWCLEQRMMEREWDNGDRSFYRKQRSWANVDNALNPKRRRKGRKKSS